FADDDFAFRVRRAGYKLVYAGDTFVYHFGSVTTGSEHVEKNSLQVSRKIFVDKYGIDAWEDASFCPYITDVVDYSKKQENVCILGINTACGATSLQVKNKYAQRGTKVYLANYLEDAKYLVDSKTISDTSLVGRLEDIAISLNETFDTIIVERGLESCRDLKKFLHSLCLLTEKGGQIYLALSNEFYYSNIIHGLNRKSTDNSDKLIQYYIDLNKLIGVLQSLGLTNIRTIRCINIMDEKQKDIIRSLSSTMPDAQLAEEILSAHKYVVCAQI
ncbi:MAG TPA: hypothetical protein DCP36_12220, partial [Sporomusaceae bacterium]|nr:hypothetical protein [Sporomusaceae bacterium]